MLSENLGTGSDFFFIFLTACLVGHRLTRQPLSHLKLFINKPQQYLRKNHDNTIIVTSQYKILKCEKSTVFSDIYMVLKIIHNAAPPLLTRFVQLCSESTSRTKRSTTRGECRATKRLTAFGRSSFS